MSQTLRRSYVVINPNGLHMRPLQAFVEQANRFQSQVFVAKKDSERLNGKSIMHLLGLAAEMGTEIVVEVSGPDAEFALEALGEVLNRIYDD